MCRSRLHCSDWTNNSIKTKETHVDVSINFTFHSFYCVAIARANTMTTAVETKLAKRSFIPPATHCNLFRCMWNSVFFDRPNIWAESTRRQLFCASTTYRDEWVLSIFNCDWLSLSYLASVLGHIIDLHLFETERVCVCVYSSAWYMFSPYIDNQIRHQYDGLKKLKHVSARTLKRIRTPHRSQTQ